MNQKIETPELIQLRLLREDLSNGRNGRYQVWIAAAALAILILGGVIWVNVSINKNTQAIEVLHEEVERVNLERKGWQNKHEVKLWHPGAAMALSTHTAEIQSLKRRLTDLERLNRIKENRR